MSLISARTRSCAHDGCSPSNCHELLHKQRQGNSSKSSFGNMLSPDDHNDIVNAFSESCRLENLAPELHSNQVQHSPLGPHHSLYGVGPQVAIHPPQSPQSQTGRPVLHYSHGPNTSAQNQPAMLEKRSDLNLHQKLQRQLSLNPNAYDPRILRMHNANTMQSKRHDQMQPEPQQVMQHRQLAPSLSGPRSHMTNHWDLHQVRCFLSSFQFNELIEFVFPTERNSHCISARRITRLAQQWPTSTNPDHG